jgi:hypothetical protein
MREQKFRRKGYDYKQTSEMDEDYFNPGVYYHNINPGTVWMCGY